MSRYPVLPMEATAPFSQRTIRVASSSLRHQLRIVHVIASSEFKLKYAESALGYVWSLLKPLGLFTMLYIVFGRFFKLNGGVAHYPLYLLIGIVLWSYVQDASSLGMTSIVARGSLLSKLAFPRLIVPVSVTVSSAITLAVNLVPIGALIAGNRIVPSVKWLLLPLLLLELYVVVLGIALILSALYVRFRDVGQVWELLLQLLFYASPIIYPPYFLPPWFKPVAFLSPFVQIIQDARSIILPSPVSQTASSVYGSPLGELAPLGVAFLLVFGGYLFFRREEPWFAERI
ncbi:MAG: ABC transporter permease [Rhodospirillales bacterium]|nr:ABC transporter permease [Rhodospirillales bacterium]